MCTMKSVLFFALLLQCLGHINGFSFRDLVGGRSSRQFDETKSETFNRLRHYETTTVSHNQFHYIDDTDNPVYPANGIIEFDAFGKVWCLVFTLSNSLTH